MADAETLEPLTLPHFTLSFFDLDGGVTKWDGPLIGGTTYRSSEVLTVWGASRSYVSQPITDLGWRKKENKYNGVTSLSERETKEQKSIKSSVAIE